ncbi:MAG: hypothetical protein WCO60_04945 [Verrucomicrobiota bacterium]
MKNKTIGFNNVPAARSLAHKLQIIATLSRAYLDAGLPFEAAVKSAVADYECCTCTSSVLPT